MNDLEKLEYIHHALQEAVRECTNEYANALLTKALPYVEDLRRYERLAAHESRYCKNSLTMGDRDD